MPLHIFKPVVLVFHSHVNKTDWTKTQKTQKVSLFYQLAWETIKVFIPKVLPGIFCDSVGLNSNEWWNETHCSGGTFTAPLPVCVAPSLNQTGFCAHFWQTVCLSSCPTLCSSPVSLFLELTADCWIMGVESHESGEDCDIVCVDSGGCYGVLPEGCPAANLWWHSAVKSTHMKS